MPKFPKKNQKNGMIESGIFNQYIARNIEDEDAGAPAR